MDPLALSTINALAVMFNACTASMCALSLAMIWFAIVRKTVWAFWFLAGCLGFLQAAGFASGHILGQQRCVGEHDFFFAFALRHIFCRHRYFVCSRQGLTKRRSERPLYAREQTARRQDDWTWLAEETRGDEGAAKLRERLIASTGSHTRFLTTTAKHLTGGDSK